jgi:molybdate transport system substrate-binding protein
MRVEFLSAGAAHGLVRALAADAGVDVGGHFGAVGAMRERFLAGEPCDLTILTHAQVAQLCGEERAEPRMSADLGAVTTSIAVPGGTPRPDVSNAEALRAALLAADAIYFPDPAKATAGIHFAKVLDRLAIAQEVSARLRPFPNGSTAMARMAEARGAAIGCTQATEILATAGVDLVAPLPAGLDLSTVYTVAVSRAARDPVAARRFYEILADDANTAARARAGFEGVRIRPATNRDGPGALRVMQAGANELGIAWPAARVAREYDDLEATFVAPGGTFDVAVGADGAVVGCAGLEIVDGDRGRLRAMHVEAPMRRRGVGRRLLDRMLAFARSRRLARVELETASSMRAAIALYSAAGFERIERACEAEGCDLAFARAP